MSKPPPVNLKERIAAIEQRNAASASSQATSANSSSQPKRLKEKISQFEQKGGVPIPRGSFGLGAPLVSDGQKSRELYGNRIPAPLRVPGAIPGGPGSARIGSPMPSAQMTGRKISQSGVEVDDYSLDRYLETDIPNLRGLSPQNTGGSALTPQHTGSAFLEPMPRGTAFATALEKARKLETGGGVAETHHTREGSVSPKSLHQSRYIFAQNTGESMNSENMSDTSLSNVQVSERRRSFLVPVPQDIKDTVPLSPNPEFTSSRPPAIQVTTDLSSADYEIEEAPRSAFDMEPSYQDHIEDLPTVTCSDCNAEVSLLELGDHHCEPPLTPFRTISLNQEPEGPVKRLLQDEVVDREPDVEDDNVHQTITTQFVTVLPAVDVAENFTDGANHSHLERVDELDESYFGPIQDEPQDINSVDANMPPEPVSIDSAVSPTAESTATHSPNVSPEPVLSTETPVTPAVESTATHTSNVSPGPVFSTETPGIPAVDSMATHSPNVSPEPVFSTETPVTPVAESTVTHSPPNLETNLPHVVEIVETESKPQVALPPPEPIELVPLTIDVPSPSVEPPTILTPSTTEDTLSVAETPSKASPEPQIVLTPPAMTEVPTLVQTGSRTSGISLSEKPQRPHSLILESPSDRAYNSFLVQSSHASDTNSAASPEDYGTVTIQRTSYSLSHSNDFVSHFTEPNPNMNHPQFSAVVHGKVTELPASLNSPAPKRQNRAISDSIPATPATGDLASLVANAALLEQKLIEGDVTDETDQTQGSQPPASAPGTLEDALKNEDRWQPVEFIKPRRKPSFKNPLRRSKSTKDSASIPQVDFFDGQTRKSNQPHPRAVSTYYPPPPPPSETHTRAHSQGSQVTVKTSQEGPPPSPPPKSPPIKYINGLRRLTSAYPRHSVSTSSEISSEDSMLVITPPNRSPDFFANPEPGGFVNSNPVAVAPIKSGLTWPSLSSKKSLSSLSRATSKIWPRKRSKSIVSVASSMDAAERLAIDSMNVPLPTSLDKVPPIPNVILSSSVPSDSPHVPIRSKSQSTPPPGEDHNWPGRELTIQSLPSHPTSLLAPSPEFSTARPSSMVSVLTTSSNNTLPSPILDMFDAFPAVPQSPPVPSPPGVRRPIQSLSATVSQSTGRDTRFPSVHIGLQAQ